MTYILRSGLTLGGGAQYSESVVRSTANTFTSTSPALFNVPSYWLFNAMADYAVNKNLSLRLNVNNLTDEAYFRLNNGGGRYYLGTARAFTLTANFKF
jgi:catecholate siderophore receptor